MKTDTTEPVLAAADSQKTNGHPIPPSGPVIDIPPKTYAQQTCVERHAELLRLLSMQAPMERIIARLPVELHTCVTATREWIQVSAPTREQVRAVLAALHAGRWEKSVCKNDSARLDYTAHIDGIEVTIHMAEPPASCRIETEVIEVPAHQKIVRTLVCTESEVAA